MPNTTKQDENSVYRSIVVVQQYLDRCMRVHCRGNPFTEQLPSDGPGIVDVFAVRYQATYVYVLSRDRCVAAAIHATIPTLQPLRL
jgi:hypothetical protein